MASGAEAGAIRDLAKEGWWGLRMTPSGTAGAVRGGAEVAAVVEVGLAAEEEGGEVDAAVGDQEAEGGVEAGDDSSPGRHSRSSNCTCSNSNGRLVQQA